MIVVQINISCQSGSTGKICAAVGELLTQRQVENYVLYNNYRLENKRVVLGVSFGWGRRKGLDVFVRLAAVLGDGYRVVLVGTNDTVDAGLPGNICSIHRTTNQEELAALYTAADVFVNPTREEVLGLTNIEALACGTPVITFDTGGSPETVDEACGAVVPKDDVAALTDRCEYDRITADRI